MSRKYEKMNTTDFFHQARKICAEHLLVFFFSPFPFQVVEPKFSFMEATQCCSRSLGRSGIPSPQPKNRNIAHA